MEQLFVIKIGGNVVDDPKQLDAFLHDFGWVWQPKILVHGGGKIATDIGNKLGIQSKYVDGRRITDEETLDLVTMVYGGLVNKKIVASLQKYDCNAIGLTGADADLIPASKRPVKDIDYGFAGDVEPADINIKVLNFFLKNKLVPVIAPLTHDSYGKMLNTNADTIASSVAIALSAEYDVRLIYCFEKKGVLNNIQDENSVITNLNKKEYQRLVLEHKLFEGILPKLENAFSAIDQGVKEVLIGDARDILQNVTEKTTGTLIVS